MTELRPCPFCGGEAHLTAYSFNSFVDCKRCGASTSETFPERAIEAWNRRTPSPTTKE